MSEKMPKELQEKRDLKALEHKHGMAPGVVISNQDEVAFHKFISGFNYCFKLMSEHEAFLAEEREKKLLEIIKDQNEILKTISVARANLDGHDAFHKAQDAKCSLMMTTRGLKELGIKL